MSNLTSKKRSLLSKLAKLRGKLSGERSELDIKLKEMEKLSTAISKLEGRRLRMDNEMRFHADRLSELKGELETLENSCSLKDLNTQIFRIKGEIRKLEERYEEELTKIEEREVTRRLEKLEGKLRQLKKHKRKILRKIRLRSEINRLEKRMRGLKVKYKEVEGKIAELRRELEELGRKCASIQSSINDLKNKMQILRDEINKADERRRELFQEKLKILASLGIEVEEKVSMKAVEEYIEKKRNFIVQGKRKLKKNSKLTFEEFKALVEEGLI